MASSCKPRKPGKPKTRRRISSGAGAGISTVWRRQCPNDKPAARGRDGPEKRGEAGQVRICEVGIEVTPAMVILVPSDRLITVEPLTTDMVGAWV